MNCRHYSAWLRVSGVPMTRDSRAALTSSLVMACRLLIAGRGRSGEDPVQDPGVAVGALAGGGKPICRDGVPAGRLTLAAAGRAGRAGPEVSSRG